MEQAILSLDPTHVFTFEGGEIDSSIWHVWGQPRGTYSGEDYVSFDTGVIRADHVTQEN